MRKPPHTHAVEHEHSTKTAKGTPLTKLQILGEAIYSSNQGFVVWDRQQKLVAWSEKCPDFWYEPKDILQPGMPMVELLRHIANKGGFGPGDPDKLAQRELSRICKAGQDSLEEFRMLDSRVIQVQRHSMQGGGHASTYMDITERKLTESELVEKEAQLRMATDAMSGGICLLDSDLNFVFFNKQYKEMYGFPEGVVEIGKPIEGAIRYSAESGFHGQGDIDDMIAARMAALRSPDISEVDRFLPNGRTLHTSHASTPEGGIATIVTDITERKQAEEALRDSEEKHRYFSANVAHALRTPLAVLRSHLDNIENTETIQSLIIDVDAMSRLVSQIFSATQLDSLIVNPIKVTDLHAIGTEVAKYLAPLAIKEGRSIEITGAQDPVLVRGNYDALELALRNLVENAIRYSVRETVVTIHVSDEPAVSVMNHGLSISPEQKKVIFQRFERADRRGDGMGLGLSIVQRVVDLHQATISIFDVFGGGAEFKISFPPLT